MNKTRFVIGMLAVALCVGQAAAQSFGISGIEGGSRTVEGTNGNGSIVLTQSVDPLTITALNSISCNAGGLHADNSYLRRFDLDGEFSIGAPFVVESVDVGVETATGLGGSQPISVIAYSIANADALTFGNLTEVGRIDTTIADATQAIVNFAFTSSAVNPATDDLVIEVFTPNGQTASHSFFIGSNNLGETGPSYIAAADCGISEPTPISAIGFPQMQIVLSVFGSSAAGNPPPETQPVPTLSNLGLILLILMLAGLALVAIRAR